MTYTYKWFGQMRLWECTTTDQPKVRGYGETIAEAKDDYEEWCGLVAKRPDLLACFVN